MSQQQFEICFDGIILYHIDHNKTLSALNNSEGDGHPDVNELVRKRLKECIDNLEKEIESLTGVSNYDCVDFNTDGMATDGF